MDLFDWVELISKMRDESLTQQEIADKIGWGKNKVSYYNQLLENVSPKILKVVKKHQLGRGERNSPNGEFDFTEGWFRNSGLYDLNEKYQERLMVEINDPADHWSVG